MESLSHTKWMCKYHIIIVPKYRRKAIFGKIKETIRDIIKQLCGYKEMKMKEMITCESVFRGHPELHLNLMDEVPFAPTSKLWKTKFLEKRIF